MPTKTKLKQALKRWQPLLANNWNCNIYIQQLEPEKMAECRYDEQNRNASIYFQPYVNDEQVDHIMIHELTHLTFAEYTSIVDKIIQQYIPATSQGFTSELLTDKEELVVNDLASAFIASQFIYKPKTKKPKKQAKIGFIHE